MGLLRTMRKTVSNPRLAARVINQYYFRAIEPLRSGIDIFDQEWDNLVILDACRYDMFEEISSLEGTLTNVRSSGSCTIEFLRKNVSNRQLHDVVYVTANPVYYRNRAELDAEFHDVINVWKEDGWDPEHRTVLPKTVTNYAEEAQDRYPNKRLLVHYLQPHYPFVPSDTEFDKQNIHKNPGDRTEDEIRFWFQLFQGDLQVDKSVIEEAYHANLRYVLEDVDRLIEILDGMTVITADHGNMLGERAFPVPIREWGHPYGVHTPELVKVPWLEVPYSSRKNTFEEAPRSQGTEVDPDVVNQRLNDLGYI